MKSCCAWRVPFIGRMGWTHSHHVYDTQDKLLVCVLSNVSAVVSACVLRCDMQIIGRNRIFKAFNNFHFWAFVVDQELMQMWAEWDLSVYTMCKLFLISLSFTGRGRISLWWTSRKSFNFFYFIFFFATWWTFALLLNLSKASSRC